MNRGIKRPRYIKPGDDRSPLRRLLEDNVNRITCDVQPEYEQQFRTMFKAQRLGYLDQNCRLTDKGREFIAEGICGR